MSEIEKRKKLLTSATQLLGNRWHCASDKKIIDSLLNSISTADFQIRLFRSACSVVYFAIKSLLLVAVCVFYINFFVFLFLFFVYILFICVSDVTLLCHAFVT